MPSDLNPIQKLDKVLFFIKYENRFLERPPIDVFYDKCANNSEKKELPLILEKLEKDGLISKSQIHPQQFMYRITFDGWVYIGYERKAKLEDEMASRILKSDKRLFVATASAAIVGLLVLLWYVFAWRCPHPSDCFCGLNP
ncbi:hypothetical protein SNE26_23605 [Mucilaginibacter sp. cycad4]|uniref:hypothetical protein n=1 Tax=Mucilaginibacter sp. cycad4 TaxID=3342096 RepID=UPI002AAB2DC4|nr:hypothetical protein [Mucilaginibacter gossypii]WPU99002.1 hypothetical protein SNE26_23605 [Mucilaginibacter gossypii]